MGCLNSEGQFSHWFSNIHLSGPCNRACYFCIGQHMMELDPLNNLDTWPLKNIDEFLDCCLDRNITEVNLTGTNTDPLLYKHIPELKEYLQYSIPSLKLGIRTNGEFFHCPGGKERLSLFDKISVSITSLDPRLYKATMGVGNPPDIKEIVNTFNNIPIKVNIVLCPETVNDDLLDTIDKLNILGIKRINLREPYGQPHIGDPLENSNILKDDSLFGMPCYNFKGTTITYWDVHYVEVESVNLYANGNVSITYPITKGYSPNGIVEGQEHFKKSGRIRKQWQYAVYNA